MVTWPVYLAVNFCHRTLKRFCSQVVAQTCTVTSHHGVEISGISAGAKLSWIPTCCDNQSDERKLYDSIWWPCETLHALNNVPSSHFFTECCCQECRQVIKDFEKKKEPCSKHVSCWGNAQTKGFLFIVIHVLAISLKCVQPHLTRNCYVWPHPYLSVRLH